MKKVLIVLTSVRPGRVADSVLTLLLNELHAYEVEIQASIFDFKDSPLPFFDGAASPSDPSFEAVDDNVKAWTQAVEQADVVLIVAAEYNFSYTAVIKNAIDWLAPTVVEGKPFAFIGYGWSGGSKAITNLRALLTGFLKASPSESEANLNFMKQINLDGSVVDAESTSVAIRGVLDSIK
ncbi:MAG: NAD(P)H-dependent oxidoreductase [bacterium]|nr:NAD(P)H-dependent oxidoreductase [bacterium]